jgi:hypothetical protein
MKRNILVVIGGIVAWLTILGSIAWANQTIKLLVNGKEIVSDVEPQWIKGRVMVPIRAVSESLGAEVHWDSQKRSVTITKKEAGNIIASLPENHTFLYALKQTAEHYDPLLLEVNGNFKVFPWKQTTNQTFPPQLMFRDLNRDGNEELIVLLKTAAGSGVYVWEAHVLNGDNLEETAVQDPLSILKQKVKTKMTSETIEIVTDGKQTTVKKANVQFEPAQLFAEVGFGSIITFHVQDNELLAVVPAQISPSGFIGEIIITYTFKDNTYQARTIDFKTT